MQIEILKSKIHHAKVTEANLHYVGSITIDENLMDAANIIEHEKVQIVDMENGERIETYKWLQAFYLLAGSKKGICRRHANHYVLCNNGLWVGKATQTNSNFPKARQQALIIFKIYTAWH